VLGAYEIVVGVRGYELRSFLSNITTAGGRIGRCIHYGADRSPRTTEEMLRPRTEQLSRGFRVALGATKARTILRVVLPAAAPSVTTGVMLAIGARRWEPPH